MGSQADRLEPLKMNDRRKHRPAEPVIVDSVCEHIEHASRANDWNTIKVYMGAVHQEWMRLDAYLDSL